MDFSMSDSSAFCCLSHCHCRCCHCLLLLLLLPPLLAAAAFSQLL
jgi:hypothetical protein